MTSSTAKRGFFPFVIGDEVSVEQGGGLAFVSKGDLRLRQGGGRWIVAGGNLDVVEGGGGSLIAAGDVNVHQGGAGLVAGRSVRLDRSYVGVAFGGKVEVGDESRLVFGSGPSLAVGLLIGFVLAKLVRLTRRGKSS
jgi:uncharacterized protein YodC (DUF2158 family)